MFGACAGEGLGDTWIVASGLPMDVGVTKIVIGASVIAVVGVLGPIPPLTDQTPMSGAAATQ
jgi:hypothetical protein